ncbi:MAG TPA: GntR family transcriptional regulator [Candidatus Sulfotelmatobacter sp.]
MQLWFARGGEVSIREQLVTQVVVGILSEDLAPGQRLPSTRELARRFKLHPNTISAGYRQLQKDRWVEFRRGSGVYVAAEKPDVPLTSAVALDQMIATLFRSARKSGISWPTLRSRLRQWLDLQPPDHFLLIEPDPELRRIVESEIKQSAGWQVQSCNLEDLPAALDGAIAVALPNRATAVRQALPAGSDLLTLEFRSVTASLAGWLPAPSAALIGIASRWSNFLKIARTMLIAAGFSPDALLVRDATEPNWQRGLKQTAAVVCDSLTATELPPGCRAIPFSLLSESSVGELRRYAEFVRQPID